MEGLRKSVGEQWLLKYEAAARDMPVGEEN